MSGFGTHLRIRASEITHRTWVLPLLIFYPTGRCNSRCVTCDWWRSTGDGELNLSEIRDFADTLPPLGTRTVAFSGGEPLLRRDVFDIAALFRGHGIRLELLTSGVLLPGRAKDVAASFGGVTISLDAADPELYRDVRGIDALDLVEHGVSELRHARPELPIRARATIHRKNFREMPALIERARAWQLDGISFLAADVSSSAFGRHGPRNPDGLMLEPDEITELRFLIEDVTDSDFVAESAPKLRRLADYYEALRGDRAFPPAACNAPWVSVVVEANGAVRPCFFHDPVGNVRETSLPEIVRTRLPKFRRALDVSSNPVCERCVCSIKVGWGGSPCP